MRQQRTAELEVGDWVIVAGECIGTIVNFPARPRVGDWPAGCENGTD